MPVQIVIITAIILLLGILSASETYYSLLRIIAFGTFAWGAYVTFPKPPLAIPLLYAFFAVLFNPLFEIDLRDEIRIPVHLAGGVILLLTKARIAR
jgi:hypothetical protein